MTPVTLPPFDIARFERLRASDGVALGVPCHFCEVTGSTNDDLMKLAREGAPHGTLCVADLQTKGRGRHGNRWSAPRPAENLLFSVLLRPAFALATASSFTLAVGLALRDALAPFLPVPVAIKWTNDLYAASHKLAGILVESIVTGERLSALVVGIGLNVQMTALPDEIATIATSLSLLKSRCLDRERLLVAILKALELRTHEYARSDIRGIIDELRQHDAIVGRTVRVGDQCGIARGLDDDGALLLETTPGQPPVRLTTGLVEL
jgi:BirA family biotin operon repressor/biotin-[acetyl-CoA-carboxylase] ligase